MATPFYISFHISDDYSASSFLENNIIVLTSNFNVEIHDEDFHYTHLIVGFLRTSDNILLSLFVDNLNLELLLFPDLFSNNKENYYNIIFNNNNNTICEKTYSKCIK